MVLSPCNFYSDSIEFVDYDYFPSSVYPNKKIYANEILEIDLKAAPPALRIKNELIFVSARCLDQLGAFAKKNNIPIIERYDIWDSILEPFLDTEFSEEHKQITLQNLKKFGLDEALIQKWRKRVSGPMVAYNFGTGLWDWVHLGQWDLLQAHKLFLGTRINEEEFTKLYWESMEIALRAYK
nr:hypothetical protein [Candidatus Freyarchaeota archaeon]